MPWTSPNSSCLVKDVMLAFAEALGAVSAIVGPKAGLLAATKSVSIAAAKLISGQHAING